MGLSVCFMIDVNYFTVFIILFYSLKVPSRQAFIAVLVLPWKRFLCALYLFQHMMAAEGNIKDRNVKRWDPCLAL